MSAATELVNKLRGLAWIDVTVTGVLHAQVVKTTARLQVSRLELGLLEGQAEILRARAPHADKRTARDIAHKLADAERNAAQVRKHPAAIAQDLLAVASEARRLGAINERELADALEAAHG